MNSAITPAYCKQHGYRTDEVECSICLGTSNMEKTIHDKCWELYGPRWAAQTHDDGYIEVAPGEYERVEPFNQGQTESFSLDTFLAEVRDSCTSHAERKGYTRTQSSDAGDVLGQALRLIGVAQDHSLGEIMTKVLEYRKEPRRVLATKIAGWAWRLWLNTEA